MLTRDRGLESDVATLLVAAGAEVQRLKPLSALSCFVGSPSSLRLGCISRCRDALCKGATVDEWAGFFQVETSCSGGNPQWHSVEEFLGCQGSFASSAMPADLVTAIKLPPVQDGDHFWSFKVYSGSSCTCHLLPTHRMADFLLPSNML